MRHGLSASDKWSRRTLIASIVLVAFALRGLIPPGFMPASDRPFSFEICSEGLPAGMLAHFESSPDSMGSQTVGMETMRMDPMPGDSMAADSSHDSRHLDPVCDSTFHRAPHQGPLHHHGSAPQSEHCVFGTACSAGPIPHLPLPSDFSSARQLRAVAFASIPVDVRVVHLPQPRAPPVRLS